MAGTSKSQNCFETTTAGEDETSEGNPANGNGDAVDVTPPVRPVSILGSENCQSILFQNLLSASQAFQGL